MNQHLMGLQEVFKPSIRYHYKTVVLWVFNVIKVALLVGLPLLLM